MTTATLSSPNFAITDHAITDHAINDDYAADHYVADHYVADHYVADHHAAEIAPTFIPALDLEWTDHHDAACQHSISFAVEMLESSMQDLLMAEPSLFGCPWCSGDDLHELPSMLWCKCCEEPAWLDRGNGMVRADQLDLVTAVGDQQPEATCR